MQRVGRARRLWWGLGRRRSRRAGGGPDRLGHDHLVEQHGQAVHQRVLGEGAPAGLLGDLLQHVIVERHDQAAAGLSLVREHDAGRCGFVVIDPGNLQQVRNHLDPCARLKAFPFDFDTCHMVADESR